MKCKGLVICALAMGAAAMAGAAFGQGANQGLNMWPLDFRPIGVPLAIVLLVMLPIAVGAAARGL
jgi:hypothetical protein